MIEVIALVAVTVFAVWAVTSELAAIKGQLRRIADALGQRKDRNDD